jgi:hypothetical protein
LSNRAELLFSLCMIAGGILAIAVRRHVSYPLSGHHPIHEVVQIVAGIMCLAVGVGGLSLLFYRMVAN